ncbi:MAG: DNA polymerase III subunit alpha [Rhizonema sp. NSF051]|nr:DNA polymerase III subunit alpha [Rhizonema sp. NSF051]
MGFVHLHVHSDFSFLDGASKLSELIARAKALGQSAIALTDHGVMHGAIQLIKQANELGIKPIIGNEMYIMNADVTSEQPKGTKKYHLLVLAKNTQGYRNLCKLTSLSHLQGVQGKGIMKRPCITKEWLQQYREGLIVTSGCVAGEIPQRIKDGNLDEAREWAKWYQELFGDDFYIEVQDHGLRGQPEDNQGDKHDEEDIKRKPDESKINPELVKIARELNIKVIATNDSHFTNESDREMHDALLCIQTNKKISDVKRMRYTGTEYLKSEDEMLQLFSDHLNPDTIREAIATTVEVADKVEAYDIFGKNHLPDYPLPPGINAEDYLTELAWAGLCDRFPKGVPDNYGDRLEYELQTLKDKGFCTYFLVVWDYIKFAREQKIPIGTGRGSCAGSLVSYSLKITGVDPIHHGLMWERFLNPERVSMPDIDTDFCIKRRKEVVDYVTQKYGTDRVTQIATFTRLQPRAALKDTGRVLDVPFMESQRMTDLVPTKRGIVTPLHELISEDSKVKLFKDRYDSDDGFKHWVDLAIQVEKINKTSGVHAAGVVIASEAIDDFVPLSLSRDGEIVSQYSMGDIEELGLLKMDFLGLKNLTVIQETLHFLEQKGIKLSEEQIIGLDEGFHQEWGKTPPPEVTKSYDMMMAGKLDGVFQLESSGMRELVETFKPSSFADLSLILALYRPGILDNDMLPTFIKRKSGAEETSYPHPLLESVLGDTFGIPIYQEQIMKIAQVMSGYSLGEADNLRRAMGKKKASVMAKEKLRFVSGAIANNVEEKDAEYIFAIIEKFAEYCFNLAHSMSYGYITWQTAYLKANYPVEFMSSFLTGACDNPDKFPQAFAATRAMNIQILPPNINESQPGFTPEGEAIRWGLGAIAGLTPEVSKMICQNRAAGNAYHSFADFCDRSSQLPLSKKHLEALVLSGAFDSLESNRNQMLADLPHLQKWAKAKHKEQTSYQINLFAGEWDIIAPPPRKEKVDDFSSDERMVEQHKMLGVYLGDTPVTKHQKRLKAIAPQNIAEILEEDDDMVAVVANIDRCHSITTKKGEPMGFLTLSDGVGTMDGVLFPSAYKNAPLSGVALIAGEMKERQGKRQLVVSAIAPAETMQSIVMVQILSPEYSHIICKFLGDKSGSLMTFVYWKSEIVAMGFVDDSDLDEIRKLGFYCDNVGVQDIVSTQKIFRCVDELYQAQNKEDLSDRTFSSCSNEMKAKVWAATPICVKRRIFEIQAS